MSNNNLRIGNDGYGQVAYTRNILSTKFISAVALANVGTNISIDLTGFSILPVNVFIAVTPGLQILVDWEVIDISGANITPIEINGELVTSYAGFSIPSTTTHLNFYPVGAPATGVSYAVFSFST